MNDLKKQYEQETERNPVYQIQPHDAGFKMPSLGYIKWLEAKLQTPQPVEVKPDVSEVMLAAERSKGYQEGYADALDANGIEGNHD